MVQPGHIHLGGPADHGRSCNEDSKCSNHSRAGNARIVHHYPTDHLTDNGYHNRPSRHRPKHPRFFRSCRFDFGTLFSDSHYYHNHYSSHYRRHLLPEAEKTSGQKAERPLNQRPDTEDIPPTGWISNNLLFKINFYILPSDYYLKN